MHRRLGLIALLALLPCTPLHARSLVLNVATNGNDSWSGELPTPTADGREGPLATLAGAVAHAREYRRRYPSTYNSTAILLRNGIYRLTEPLVLTPEDSGADAGHAMVITSYPNERATLSGGERIQGWQPVPGKPDQWQTEIADVRDGRWFFRQLFVNGQRRQRARTPNDGFFRIEGDSPRGKPAKFKFKAGDIKPEWAAAGDVELVAFLAWSDLRMPIVAVDTNANVVTLAGEPRESNREANAQYFIENTPDALDQAGEWYLDRKKGILTYWALPGENPNRLDVIAPRLNHLIALQGDLAALHLVHHVVLRGLTFAHTDWTLPPEGQADTQAAIAVAGDVRAEALVDSTIEDCTFTHLGGYGLELGRGCQRIRVVGNEFVDLGAGGIRVGETRIRPADIDQCTGHTITDNHLHQLGRVYAAGVGVLILQSGHNRVAHNEIHDLYYTAVSVGWNWGYQETPCHDNVIEFNHLHHIGLRQLSDMGAIYTLGIQPGTVIRHNLIHDVEAFTYGGWGLYTDEGSTGIRLENNVVYHCKSAGFHQHYGRENLVQNNIFAFNRENQLMRSRDEEHLSFTFTNNIVYFDSGDLLGSSWKNDRFLIDGNLYFDSRPEARPETMRFSGATLKEWRQRGHDLNSAVADPLFVNPSRFNFRLTPNSPALKRGFVPIDLATVGIRRKGQRN